MKGVSYCIQTDKWKACIQAYGRERTLGRYDTIQQAAEVYAEHAKRLHGAFACYQNVGG